LKRQSNPNIPLISKNELQGIVVNIKEFSINNINIILEGITPAKYYLLE
jgi:hypothetical protein